METFPEPDVETLEGDVQATLKMVSWRKFDFLPQNMAKLAKPMKKNVG